MARPKAEANLAGYAADIDRAIARDMEAAGVEPFERVFLTS